MHFLEMEMLSPFVTSFGRVTKREFIVIEMVDRNGKTGWGECVAFTSPWYTEETQKTCYHMMKEFFIPLLLKTPIEHPDDVSSLFSFAKRNNMAKAALEAAVWDLYAQQTNQSLALALGGTRSQIETGISIGLQPSNNALFKEIEKAINIGYKRVKIKIDRKSDLPLLETIRQRYPDIPLMADANSGYTLTDAEHLLKFDHLNLMMIEQPLGDQDIYEHMHLQSQLETPICLDESIHSLEDAKNAIRLGSCKIINIKSGRVGGLSEAVRIHDYCLKHHIPVWCGGMLESGIGRAHNIALASLPGFSIPGDISASSRYWKEDIIHPEVTTQNGTINVPLDKIGIGYEIDREKLKKFSTSPIQTFTL
ncbi:MAG: o-succinylbenzoate synthase [Bacillales bacterium]|nr:o-succinylbenzoate synthase [Bacillales bacterium]